MNIDLYKEQFSTLLSGITDEDKGLLEAREKAFKWFTDNGLPSKKDELWQYTDLSNFGKNNYSLLVDEGSKPSKSELSKVKISDSNKILIINGKLNPTLSDYSKIHVKINNINDGEPLDSSKLNNAFLALNASMKQGGYHIQIDAGYNSEKPLHIINYIDGKQGKAILNQYNSISIAKNGSVTIIEETIVNNNDIFHNNLTEIDLDENASLEHTILQDNDAKSFAVNHYFVHQSNDSNYNAQSIIKNGALIRNELIVDIDGSNCTTNVYGLGLLEGKDHIENYTNVTHQKPNCNSLQLFKYLLKDSAEGVFNGLVKVNQYAQQTDSQQTNRNILLSKKALMNSNPQLEIYADDVKCGHGSATGELDEDAIFYLRSRGLDMEMAKSLLTEGFVKEIIDKISNDSLRERVNNILQNWLIN